MSMKLGTTSLNAVYLGTTSIAALYLGAAQVFGGGAVEFDPASLFASGEKGAWYDPSDLTTMWTDTAGTTQAVAVLEGDTPTAANAVARIDDKSGNGNHAIQVTAPSRPYLTVTAGGLYYLSFDGVDDFLTVRDSKAVPDTFDDWSDAVMLAMATNADDITGTSAGGFTARRTIFSHREDASITSAGYRVTLASGYEAGEFRLGFKDSSPLAAVADTAVYDPAANATYVQLSYVDGDVVEARFDGASVISATLSTATGDRSTSSGPIDIFIGARSTNTGIPTDYFGGAIYGLIYRNAVPATDEITNTEAYLATRSGVTL